MSPSIVALTELSWIPRFCATAATPAVRQLARPTSTNSTGVGPLSSEAKTSGWSASKDHEERWLCSPPRPKKLLIASLAVGAPEPLVAGTPGELRSLRGVHERRAGVEERLDIDSVVSGGFAGRHRSSLGWRSRTRSPLTRISTPGRGSTRRFIRDERHGVDLPMPTSRVTVSVDEMLCQLYTNRCIRAISPSRETEQFREQPPAAACGLPQSGVPPWEHAPCVGSRPPI